jgi:hypothetical protein
MPTNTNAYNSRVTDEALEKRFRDTFTSQGGAELVDDLYAQGVIVPIVDFTAAATGQQLAENLQTAYDSATVSNSINNTTENISTTAGFWKVNVIVLFDNVASDLAKLQLNDGVSTPTVVWRAQPLNTGSERLDNVPVFQQIVVFVNSGQTLQASSGGAATFLSYSARQIATVSGDLVNPSGFTGS